MKNHSLLEKSGSVATIVIAAAAVAALYFSVQSSREVSETLADVEAAMQAYSRPLMDIPKWEWAYEGDAITCDNPPIGIFFDVRNVSNVPIRVLETDYSFFFGELELDEVVETFEGSSYILVAGDSSQSGVIMRETFQTLLRGHTDAFRGPLLDLDFKALFSRLGADERYIYHTRLQIGFDCRVPLRGIAKPVFETVEETESTALALVD